MADPSVNADTGERQNPAGWSVDDPSVLGGSVLRKGMDLIEERRKAGDEEVKALEEKGKAQEKYIDRGLHKLEEPQPAHAQLEKLKAAPNPEDYKKYTMEFLGAMTLVGAFASRKSRNVGNAALKAFTGAMTGWQQGNLEAYAQATRQWEENTKALIENNRIELERYQEAIGDRSRSIDEMKLGLLLAAMKSESPILVAQLKQGNLDAGLKYVDMLARLTERVQGAADPLMTYNKQNAEMYKAKVNDLNAHPERLANVKWEDFVRLKAQSDSWRKYDSTLPELKDPGPQAQFAQTGGQFRTVLPNLIAAFKREHGRDPTVPEIEKMSADYAGDVSMARAAGTQAARVESATNEVAALVPQALETSRALPRSKFVPWNKLMQQWQAGTSDPAYNDFVIANFSLMNAYARAMNPSGQPRVTERFEAKASGVLNQATDQKSYEVQLRRLWKEVQASKGAVAKTRSGETGGEEFPEPSGEGGGPAGGPVQVKTPEEAERLPPGTTYITPDGQRYTR